MAPKHFKGGGGKNQKWKEEISSETKGAGSIATSCWGLASTIYTVLQDTSENKETIIGIWTKMVQLKINNNYFYTATTDKIYERMLIGC